MKFHKINVKILQLLIFRMETIFCQFYVV